nr:reverse transcriptase domain-containing protein [Tanacetum cinerariifolium]
MADNRTMAKMLRAPTEGCAEAIVVLSILAEQLELKHSLINMMTSEQFFGLEKDNPHDHIRCFEIAKLTHAVNQQTSDVTIAVTAMLKQLQATPPPAPVKAVEEICFTCGGAHPYYQCLAAGGNTFPEFKDNIQGYVLAAASNYNQGNLGYRPQGVANQMRPPGFAQPNVQNNQNRLGQPQGFNRDTNFNQEQPYQATAQQNQNFHLNELEKIKRINDVSMKVMQNQIDMVKNELRNEMKTSIQTYLSNQTNEIKNMMASLLQMNTASTSGSGSLSSNTVANPKGELKAITTRSGLITNGPTVPTPPKSITPKVDERVEETFTDPNLAEYTIKVPPPPVQKHKPPSQRNFVVHTRDSPLSNIPYPSRMLKQKQQEKDEVQIEKFWHMFKQLHLNITLAEALVLMPKYQKMLKSLLSNKEKLQELANTPLNENCSAVIHKKLPEKLRDPGKFLILCGFSELKCKALADLGASINLMPLSVWKKLCLPDLIPTHMTLELANRAICTPDGIARDVFIPIARALIDVHREEMILRNEGGNVLPEKFLDLDSTKDLHPPHNVNPLSGSTTSSPPNHLLEEFADELAFITFPPGNNDLPFDIESDHKEIEYLLNNDPIKDMDSILEDSVDEDNLVDLNDNLADTMPEMFTNEHALDYSSPPLYDEYDDDLFEVESDTEYIYNDPFDSKGEKIKEPKLLIDELDLPSDFLPSSKYDSFLSEDFFEVDALPSTNNEDKVFNPRILIRENFFEVITRVTLDKNDKKLAISHASLILGDFDLPLYELLFFKEVPMSKTLLSFSLKNEKKVFKPGIHTSKEVHSFLIPELSHQGYKVFKIIKILKSPTKIVRNKKITTCKLLDKVEGLVLLIYNSL